MNFTDSTPSAAHASYRIKGNQLNDFPDEEDLRSLRRYQVDRINVLVQSADMHSLNYQRPNEPRLHFPEYWFSMLEGEVRQLH